MISEDTKKTPYINKTGAHSETLSATEYGEAAASDERHAQTDCLGAEADIKVSVIMPVYKVEDYVAKAIDSVIAQRTSDGRTFEDWELIAVDDGSPDKSGEICDAYAEKDSRIKVIHQQNAGAPAARNRAIDIARGKYLMFLDSDDYCGETMLSDMYELAEKDGAQLVISGFYIETYYGLGKKLKAERQGKSQNKNGIKEAASKNENVIKKASFNSDKKENAPVTMQNGPCAETGNDSRNYLISDYIPEAGSYTNRQDFRKAAYKLFDHNMLYPPWNKLYLKSYITEHKLYFPETFWDDFPFVLSVIRDIDRVSVTDRQYYHFLRARTESETQKYVPKMYEKREEEHGWMVELYKHWGLWYGVDNEQNREMVARRYIDRLIGCFENLTNPNCKLSTAEKKQEIRKMLHTDNAAFGLRHARPRSLYSKLMYLPLKWRSTGLTYLEAAVITYVKNHDMKLFASLKTKR